MSWRDLLEPESGATPTLTLPWAGGREVYSPDRVWAVVGRLPPEHGWYAWSLQGRRAKLSNSERIENPSLLVDTAPFFEAKKNRLTGYLVGDRFIRDNAYVDPNPDKLIAQTEPAFCIELGLERFARATVFRNLGSQLIYLKQEWPTGPEAEVLMAYQDRKPSVTDIRGVTPALDLAFRWISWGRVQAEERAREVARLRAVEEARLAAEARMQQAMRDAGTGAGRRALAEMDFEVAARAALAISGAELLDCRATYNRNEMVVQYRFQQRRLECVVDKRTLSVIEAGFCLTDHNTGVKGDKLLSLEALPLVAKEAIEGRKLVVWRHVPGDQEDDYEDDD